MNIKILTLDDINLLAKEKNIKALREISLSKLRRINPQYKKLVVENLQAVIEGYDVKLKRISEIKQSLQQATKNLDMNSHYYTDDGRQLLFDSTNEAWVDGDLTLKQHEQYMLPVDETFTLVPGRLIN